MSALQNVASQFRERRLDDVLIQGYIESDSETPKFNAVLDRLHFVFGDEYLDVVNDAYNKYMVLMPASVIEPGFEVDEDDQFALFSYFDVLLLDTVSEVKVSSIDIFEAEVVDCYVRCRAVNVRFENGESFFVDSSYYDGLKIGGVNVFNKYMESNPDSKSVNFIF